jgi:hypothetical protein
MTLRRRLLTGVGIIAILFGILFVAANVAFRSVDDISSWSPLRFMVDGEIRRLSVPGAASSIHFRSEPADGTRPQLDGASIRGGDMDAAVAAVRAYFSRRGYTEQERGALFVKPQVEVRLTRTGSRALTVTKYSWR